MNREQRRKQMKTVVGGNSKSKVAPKNPDEFVKRQEIFDIVAQLGNEIGIVQEGLMKDVNTMYSYHLFPAQMEIAALEKLLIDKGMITQKEIDDKVQEHKQSILDRAEQIKENADGSLEKVSKEEAENNEKRAVVKASGGKRKNIKK